MNVPVSAPVPPSPLPPIWTELTVERQRRAVRLIAQLAVKLALALATSTPSEVCHDDPNTR